MLSPLSPGERQSIMRAVKVVQEQAIQVVNVLSRIADTLDQIAARMPQRARDGTDLSGGVWGLVKTYHCENGAMPSTCRLCAAPLGQPHQDGCLYLRRD